MMSDYQVAGFNLPHIGSTDRLQNILSLALKDRIGVSDRQSQNQNPYWDATHFGLDRVGIFREANPDRQTAILQIASYGLLAESYLIEKAGMGYMAKMVLLAETTEERMLYALFSAEEATHFAQVSNFLPSAIQIDLEYDAFLKFLAQLVETEDKSILQFVLQVVLEGWGISHYRNLAKDCRSIELGSLFASFLQDEAQHHRTGSILFDRSTLTKSSQDAIVEALTIFLRMIQVGPQQVLDSIAKVEGDLSRSQKLKILEELDTETHSGSRLKILRGLMRQASDIVDRLEQKGCFLPLPAHKCV